MKIKYFLYILYVDPSSKTTTTTNNLTNIKQDTDQKKNTGVNPVWQGTCSLFTSQLKMFVYKNLSSGIFTLSETTSIEN